MNVPTLRTNRACVSLAVIARNEEAVIGRCLESAKQVVDELIVVDTGSQDRTRELASKAGAKVIECPWVDDFSAARNASLDACAGEWILVLDADEYLPESSGKAIRHLLSKPCPSPRAFQLINKSSTDGGKTGMLGKIVRLFPNRPDVRYEWPVHEQVATSLQRANIPIFDTDIEIIHTGYSSTEVNQKKQTRNLRILDGFLSKTPDPHPMLYFLHGGALLDLGRPSDALQAYQRCQEKVSPRDPLHQGAIVRQATCLADLERFSEIRGLAPSLPLEQCHPELLLFFAQAELNAGNKTTAINHLQLAIEKPDCVSIPAYDPVRARARAALMLAEAFQHSLPKASISLLRLAKDSLATGHRIKMEDVLSAMQS